METVSRSMGAARELARRVAERVAIKLPNETPIYTDPNGKFHWLRIATYVQKKAQIIGLGIRAAAGKGPDTPERKTVLSKGEKARGIANPSCVGRRFVKGSSDEFCHTDQGFCILRKKEADGYHHTLKKGERLYDGELLYNKVLQLTIKIGNKYQVGLLLTPTQYAILVRRSGNSLFSAPQKLLPFDKIHSPKTTQPGDAAMSDVKMSTYDKVMETANTKLWNDLPDFTGRQKLVLCETDQVAQDSFKEFKGGFKSHSGELSTPTKKKNKAKRGSGPIRREGKEVKGTENKKWHAFGLFFKGFEAIVVSTTENRREIQFNNDGETRQLILPKGCKLIDGKLEQKGPLRLMAENAQGTCTHFVFVTPKQKLEWDHAIKEVNKHIELETEQLEHGKTKEALQSEKTEHTKTKEALNSEKTEHTKTREALKSEKTEHSQTKEALQSVNEQLQQQKESKTNEDRSSVGGYDFYYGLALGLVLTAGGVYVYQKGLLQVPAGARTWAANKWPRVA